MNKHFKTRAFQGLFLLSLLGFSACVDNDYDLSKDVDMTITVGGENLSIPGSNTDLITLEKIFDLAPESDVRADANGDYALTMNGEGTESTVNVEGVTVEGSQIETTASTTDLYFQYVPAQATETTVDTEASFAINKPDVTTDVVALHHVNTEAVASLNLTFNGNAKNIHLGQGFRITFPDYMAIGCSDVRFAVEDSHVLTFNTDVAIASGAGLSIPVTLSAIDFNRMPAGEVLVAPGHLVVNGTIPVEGRAYMNAEDFITQRDLQLILNTELNIGNINFTEVTAVVNPQIDITIDPVTINDLPEFLQDERVKIDMTDPKIFLYITNGSPVAVNFTAEMKPYKDGKLLSTVVLGNTTGGAGQIVIPANVTDYAICLHRLTDETGIEADDIITVADINNLIATIPDEIRTENIVATAVQAPVNIKLGSGYTVKTDYNVVAPLQFNSGTEIVYSDQMDGWNGDVEDLDVRHAEVSLNATNTIPLSMVLSANAIDMNGNVMDDITATVEGNVNAGTPASPSTNNLTIRLEAHTDDALSRLDGISYEVKATIPAEHQGTVLNTQQALTLDNVVITVKGGVTVDLN